MKITTLISAILLLLASCNHEPKTPVRVKVTGGQVEGFIENGLAKFYGIPFAATTAGENRWKEPQPVQPWDSVRKADKFAPACPQVTFSFPGAPKLELSEDCLYLNVWSPAQNSNEKLPVMVWIYGGGFAMGSTNMAGNYGDSLAKKGVIVVSIAYRVGPLGFMAHPELSKESPKGISGNYGLLDQIAGLKWVQENIAAFGGDPSRVTIFGESAGGISVSMLCASPLAKGLFSGAISESGGSFGPVKETKVEGGTQTLASAELEGVAFMERMGAKSIAELRKVDPEKWAKDSKSQMGGFWPVADGYVITDDQYKLYQEGNYNNVPVLIGTNSDEGVMFVRPMPVADYKKQVEERFAPFGQKVLELYPANTEEETHPALADLFRETAFAWPTFAWANLQTASAKSPVYMYYFNQQQPANPWIRVKIRGAGHGAEVGYVFKTLDKKAEQADKDLSELMATYWTNFAKTGNPNGDGLPVWPVYKPGTNSVMYLNSNPSIGPVANLDKMELMEEIYKYRREN